MAGKRKRSASGRSSLGEKIATLERRLIELPGKLVAIVLVGYYSVREFHRDLCLDRAATLSFATLLSLIPLVVLFFSFAGQFGGGEEIISFVEDEVFEFVAPEVHGDISTWLNDNISKDAFSEGKTGIVNIGAIIALVTAALGLLTSAERIFNRIWKAKGNRSYWKRLAAFWIVLTTSPFLIAASLSLNQFLVPKGGALDELIQDHAWLGTLYGSIIPFIVAMVGISMLYLFLPATRVRLRSAVIGGIVAAGLWSLSKAGFYVYVANATTARTLYGQLATVPLFLLWLYISWVIVLHGLEVSYAHQNLRALRRAGGRKVLERSRLYLGLEMLSRIRAALETSQVPQTTLEMALDIGVRHEDMEDVASSLRLAGLIVESAEEPGQFVLARSPAAIGLGTVARLLVDEEFPGEGVAPHDRERDQRDLRPSPAADLTGEAWRGLVAALDGKCLANFAIEDGPWLEDLRTHEPGSELELEEMIAPKSGSRDSSEASGSREGSMGSAIKDDEGPSSVAQAPVEGDAAASSATADDVEIDRS